MNLRLFLKYVTRDVRSITPHETSYVKLPFNTVIHALQGDDGAMFNHKNFPFTANPKKGATTYVSNVYKLSSELLKPMDLKQIPLLQRKIKKIIAGDKHLKLLHKDPSVIRKDAFIVYNYVPLFTNYKYTKREKDYYKAYNILSTVIQTVTSESLKDKEQFITINIEKALTIGLEANNLKRLSNYEGYKLRRSITNMHSLLVIEVLFFILNKESAFGALTDEQLVHLNLLFVQDKKVVIFNMLQLKSQFMKLPKESAKLIDPIIKAHAVIDSFTRKLQILGDVGDVLAPEEEAQPEEVSKDKPNVVAEAVAAEVEKLPPFKPKESDDEVVKSRVTQVLQQQDISANKRSTLKKRVKQALNLPSPLDPHTKLSDAVKVSKEELVITEETIANTPETVKKDYAKDKIKQFNKNYLTKTHQKDVLATIQSLNKMGALVTDIKVQKSGSILGEEVRYSIKVQPVDGTPSTIHVSLPKVDEGDGTFTSNGTKYIMSKQRVDLPIRKIDASTVILSSYSPKLFVQRSTAAVDDLGRWMLRQINRLAGEDDTDVLALEDNVHDNLAKTPSMYGYLSQHYAKIDKGNLHLDLIYKTRGQLLKSESDLSKLEKNGMVICGKKAGKPVGMGKDDKLYVYKDGKWSLLGSIYEVFNINERKAPRPLVTLKSLGKTYPLILILIYSMGLIPLLKYLKVSYEIIPSNKRTKEEKIYFFKFMDVNLVIKKADAVASMLLQGLQKNIKILKLMSLTDFNLGPNGEKPEGVDFILLENDLPVRHVKEMDIILNMFIDSMTKRVLEHMHEPTNMEDLLLRACELITTLDYPNKNNPLYMRERGYERFAGAIHGAMVKAVRKYHTALNPKKRNINFSSHEVMSNVLADNTVSPTEDINPLASLREAEMVTYLGEGGRMREAMTGQSRIFDPDDVGILSPDVPDSGSVGINAYLSANPNITNTMGMHDPNQKPNFENSNSTVLLSTPGLDRDHPMRAVMSHIQQSHVVTVKGAKPCPIRTGMEYAVAGKVPTSYANLAEGEGKVIKIGEYGITVKYKDKEVSYPLGMTVGTAEGKRYPHELITDLKVGDKIKKGEAISYHKGYFEKDTVYPGKLIYKQSVTIPLMFTEGPWVHEDSCVLYEGLADDLGREVIYKEDITVDFGSSLVNLPKIGAKIAPGDIIAVVDDEIADMGGDTGSTNNTLLDLTRQAVRSENGGYVEKIEVLYNGLLSDMSPSLKNLAKKSNKMLKQIAKDQGKTPYTGETFGELRIKGKVIGDNQAVVSIFIRSSHHLHTGDKFAFSSQLKATLGHILTKPIVSLSGRKALGMFSFKADAARMALSGIEVPIALSLLRHIPIYVKQQLGKS